MKNYADRRGETPYELLLHYWLSAAADLHNSLSRTQPYPVPVIANYTVQ